MRMKESIVGFLFWLFTLCFIVVCVYMKVKSEQQENQQQEIDNGLIQFDSDSIEFTTEPFIFD